MNVKELTFWRDNSGRWTPRNNTDGGIVEPLTSLWNSKTTNKENN